MRDRESILHESSGGMTGHGGGKERGTLECKEREIKTSGSQRGLGYIILLCSSKGRMYASKGMSCHWFLCLSKPEKKEQFGPHHF